MASREALGVRGMLNHGLADGRAQNFQRVNLTKPPPSLAHVTGSSESQDFATRRSGSRPLPRNGFWVTHEKSPHWQVIS